MHLAKVPDFELINDAGMLLMKVMKISKFRSKLYESRNILVQ